MKKIATGGFLFVIAMLCTTNLSRAADSKYAGLTITEMMFNPAGKNSEHAKWVELANLSADKLTLYPTGSETASGWKIKDLKITDSSSHYLYTPKNSPIEIDSGDYLIIADNLPSFGNDYPNSENVALLKSAITLTTADSEGLYHLTLYDGGNILNTVSYSKDWYPNTDDKGKSLEKVDLLGDIEKENWQESCKNGGTPGKEPEVCEIEMPASGEKGGTGTSNKETGSTDAGTEENFSPAEGVYLNEIFPNPKNKADDEYIEIANNGHGPVDLHGWTLRDASKTGKYVFKEHRTVESGEYLVIYKAQSKISLNNSGESVYLYDPQNELISSASYAKSSKGASYSFDGQSWRWSIYPTPGAKNKFDSEPVVKVKRPKNIYKNIPIEFSAKAKDKETKKLKYAWDFGDGKKSYLKSTSHKYLATGKYAVTLSVSDDSQTVEKGFTLTVKNSPRPDLEIVKIVPNPAGSDSDGETIDLKNNSTKKVSLDGWKIASGSAEKMYNHPLRDGLVLGANETKTIAREISKFSLNNKAGKVELISPDGKTVDVVEYEKEKIADDEVYAKVDDEWVWLAPDTEEGGVSPEEDNIDVETTDENTEGTGEVLGTMTENAADSAPEKTSYSTEDAFIFFNLLGILDNNSREINYCSANQANFSLPSIFVSLI